jgi:hypothetical protein
MIHASTTVQDGKKSTTHQVQTGPVLSVYDLRVMPRGKAIVIDGRHPPIRATMLKRGTFATGPVPTATPAAPEPEPLPLALDAELPAPPAAKQS